MPAPRNCRSCGAPIQGDVRWCLRCHAPVRELTARARLHAEGVAGMPRPTVATSRTKASATTFGLRGRIAITAAVGLVTLQYVGMLFGGAVAILPIVVPGVVFAVVVLRQVWKAVPVDDAFEAPRIRPTDIWRAGVEPDPDPGPPRTTAMLAWRAVGGLALAGAIVAWVVGPNEVRAAVLASGAVIGLIVFVRGS